MPLLGWLPLRIAGWIAGAADSFAEIQRVEFLVIVALLLVPTTLLGSAFPLAVRLAGEARGGAGLPVGLVYAWNTAGAIAGAFLAGFVLIPAIGLSRIMVNNIFDHLD